MAQAIVSAVIAGIFSLIGVVLNNRLKRQWASTLMQTVTSSAGQPAAAFSPTAATPQTIPPFSIGQSLIHIGVIQFMANVVGLILGLVIGITGQIDTMTPESFILIILVAGSCVLIVSFAISGAKVNRVYRWQHLFYVALGVAISTLLVNYLILNSLLNLGVPFDFSSLVVASVQTFVCMGIGGALANAIAP